MTEFSSRFATCCPWPRASDWTSMKSTLTMALPLSCRVYPFATTQGCSFVFPLSPVVQFIPGKQFPRDLCGSLRWPDCVWTVQEQRGWGALGLQSLKASYTVTGKADRIHRQGQNHNEEASMEKPVGLIKIDDQKTKMTGSYNKNITETVNYPSRKHDFSLSFQD